MSEKISFLDGAKDKVTSFKDNLKTLVENIAILPARTKLVLTLLLGTGVSVSAKELDDKADASFFGNREAVENVLSEDTFSDAENEFNINGVSANLETIQDTIKNLGTEKEEPYWSNSNISDIGRNPAISNYTAKRSNENSLSLTKIIKNLITEWNKKYPNQIGAVEEIEKAHREYYDDNTELKPSEKNYKFDFGRGEKIENPLSSKNYVYLTVPLNFLYIRQSSSASGEVKDYNNSISNLSADVFVIMDKNLSRIIWAAPDGCGNASILGYLQISEVKPEVIKEIVTDTVYTPKDTVFIPVDCPEKPEEVSEEGFSITPKVEIGANFNGEDGRSYHGLHVHRNAIPENYIDAYYIELTDDQGRGYNIGLKWSEKDGRFVPGTPEGKNNHLSGTTGTANPQYITVNYGEGKSKTFKIPWAPGDGDKTFDPFLWEDYIASKLGPNFLVNLGAEIRHSDAPDWYGEAGVSASIYPKNLENTSFNVYLEAGKDFKVWERDGQVGLKFYSPSIGPSVRNAFEPGSWGIQYGFGADINLEILKGMKFGIELIYTKGNDNDIQIGKNSFTAKGEDKWNVAFKFIF